MKIEKTGHYRIFSTHIFKQRYEVSCGAFSIGDRAILTGLNPLKDSAAFQELARYWRAKLELSSRRSDDYDPTYQSFILVDDVRIPVDHICAEVNGAIIRLDFTSARMYVSRDSRVQWTASRYKAFRLFASAIRRAALKQS
ncbi:hypothetical protein F6X40_24015 [Paraburkholderia sp. UCT31]|uniref:hypothetical protein n=1 Tax=Paraburkholderia sp. UCT31 TaxID=2615209 RepID=UPI0016556C8E|nr:hypothetical protein [Paraburkholderia sp. UCT31]MBC8739783.1 hypothetical protein [Paraburkholderia sp. UCT31]